MTKLALDLGTLTGFAIGDARSAVISGTWDLRAKRFENVDTRFVKFRGHLDATWRDFQPSSVYFEDVKRHLGTQAAHVYGGLKSHMAAWCIEHEIPYRGVSVGTLKKFWTNNARASKDDMMHAARVRGYEPADDNQADALALLTWSWSK